MQMPSMRRTRFTGHLQGEPSFTDWGAQSDELLKVSLVVCPTSRSLQQLGLFQLIPNSFCFLAELLWTYAEGTLEFFTLAKEKYKKSHMLKLNWILTSPDRLKNTCNVIHWNSTFVSSYFIKLFHYQPRSHSRLVLWSSVPREMALASNLCL